MVRNHQHRFQGEFAFTVVEEVFQTRAEEVYDHYIIFGLDPIVIYARHAGCNGLRGLWGLTRDAKIAIQFGLIVELRMAG